MWAAEWVSTNALDGERRHLLHRDGVPALFRTRVECRRYIRQYFGHIRTRPDLRAEPHGWRMPQPVRVEVSRIIQRDSAPGP